MSSTLTLYNNRGNSFRKKGDYDQAIADFNEALKISPSFVLAFWNRGAVYLDKGDYERAIADYDEALKRNPNDPEFTRIYVERGLAYYRKGDFDRAIADYTEAIKRNARVGNAYRFRGHAYLGKPDFDRAIADYTKVIELAPKDAEAYNGRAWTYYLKGDHERAVADATVAIAHRCQEFRHISHARRGLPRSTPVRPRHRRLQPGAGAGRRAVLTNVAERGMAYEAKGDRDRAIGRLQQGAGSACAGQVGQGPAGRGGGASRGAAASAAGGYRRVVGEIDSARCGCCGSAPGPPRGAGDRQCGVSLRAAAHQSAGGCAPGGGSPARGRLHRRGRPLRPELPGAARRARRLRGQGGRAPTGRWCTTPGTASRWTDATS